MSNDVLHSIVLTVLWLLIPTAVIGVWIGTAVAASRLAPDRSSHFFWATLLVLGRIGIAAALVAQPRDTAPPRRPTAPGRRRFICPRCGADNDIPESDRSYDCWRCSDHRKVEQPKKVTPTAKKG
jgi:DNA-directed RNA polymerase subunit RPC12/RpoP